MDMTEQLNWTKLNSSDIRFAAWCIWSRTTCVLHCFSRVQLFATPWTVACQAPLSMGFSQEYWSRLPCSPPGNLPYWGIKTVSLISPGLAGRYETLWFTSHMNTLFQRNYKFCQWFCFVFPLSNKKCSQEVSLLLLRFLIEKTWASRLKAVGPNLERGRNYDLFL